MRLLLTVGKAYRLLLTAAFKPQIYFLTVGKKTSYFLTAGVTRKRWFLLSPLFAHYFINIKATSAAPTTLDLLTNVERLLKLIAEQLKETALFDRYVSKLSGGMCVEMEESELRMLWAVESMLLSRYEMMRSFETNGIKVTTDYFDLLYSRTCLEEFFNCQGADYSIVAAQLGLNSYIPLDTPYDIIDPNVPIVQGPIPTQRYKMTEVWSNDTELIGSGMFKHTFIGPKYTFATTRTIRAISEAEVNGISLLAFVSYSGNVITLPFDYPINTEDTFVVKYES